MPLTPCCMCRQHIPGAGLLPAGAGSFSRQIQPLFLISHSSAVPCAGDTYLVLDRSLRDVAAHLAASVQSNIRLRWPVTFIRRDAGGVTLQGSPGRCASLDALSHQTVLHTTIWSHVMHLVTPAEPRWYVSGLAATFCWPLPFSGALNCRPECNALQRLSPCKGMLAGGQATGCLLHGLCCIVKHTTCSSCHAGGVMLSRCRASLGGLQAASSVKEALQASELLPCHSGLALHGTPPQAFF